MHFLQLVLTVLSHEIDQLVPLLRSLIHFNRQLRFSNGCVELFSGIILSLGFELLSLFDVHLHNFFIRDVFLGDPFSLVKLFSSSIHSESVSRLPRSDVVLFS